MSRIKLCVGLCASKSKPNLESKFILQRPAKPSQTLGNTDQNNDCACRFLSCLYAYMDVYECRPRPKMDNSWSTRLAPVIKTIFHQCVISYTCSQSNSDVSVLEPSELDWLQVYDIDTLVKN